jgi:hypothetical protein
LLYSIELVQEIIQLIVPYYMLQLYFTEAAIGCISMAFHLALYLIVDKLSAAYHPSATLQPMVSLPHMLVQPKVVCTFTVQQSIDYSTSLPGLHYRPDRKYQSTMAPGFQPLINIISSASHTCSYHERALLKFHFRNQINFIMNFEFSQNMKFYFIIFHCCCNNRM